MGEICLMNKTSNLKKFLALTITTSLVAGVSLPVSAINDKGSESNFSDIKEDSFYYKGVHHLYELGILKGYTDGTFRPEQRITRAEAALMIAASIPLTESATSPSSFKDIKEGSWYYEAVMKLEKSGIINGKTKDTFEPHLDITRAELAIMLTRAFKLKENQTATNQFSDVEPNSYYSGSVGALIEYGITEGLTKTTYGPENSVKRGQMATFLYRALEKTAFVMEEVKEHTIIISGKEYKIDTSLKGLLNEGNSSLLKDGMIRFEEENGVITSIQFLEIKQTGTKDNERILDAKGATIIGDLIIAGDYLRIKNLKVKGNLLIGEEAQNKLSTEQIMVEGTTSFAFNSRNLTQDVRIASGIIFQFNPHNSSINTIISVGRAQADTVSINASGTTQIQQIQLERNTIIQASQLARIDLVRINRGVDNVGLEGKFENVEVRVDSDVLRITGTADLQKLAAEMANELILEIQGRINEVKAENVRLMELRKELAINNFLSSQDKELSDLIRNYDQVKSNIENIAGQPNRDAVKRPEQSIPPTPIRDTTPPVLSGAEMVRVGTNNFEFNVTSNENGKVYYVVYPSEAVEPTPSQVKSGAGALFSGSQSINADTVATIEVNELERDTSYKVYFAVEDRSLNLSTISVLEFTTLADEDLEPPVLIDETSIISFDTDMDGLIDHMFVGFSEVLRGASLSSVDVKVEGYEVTSANTSRMLDELPYSLPEYWEGTGEDGNILVITIAENGEQSRVPLVTIAADVLQDLAGNNFAGVEKGISLDPFPDGPPIESIELQPVASSYSVD